MSHSGRFVLDTNVIVSALAFARSKPRKAFDLAADCGMILISDETWLELYRTLRKPRLAAYFTRAEQDAFMTMLADRAVWIRVTERLAMCRDPRDDKFLELALSGGASHLLTGDRDLLVLDPVRSTRILSPAALVNELGRR
jgi:putative PIN family toxin of toxin-antitoxin system